MDDKRKVEFISNPFYLLQKKNGLQTKEVRRPTAKRELKSKRQEILEESAQFF